MNTMNTQNSIQKPTSERAQIAELVAVCVLLFFLFFKHIMAIVFQTVLFVFLFVSCLLLFSGAIGLMWRILRGLGLLKQREALLATLNLITRRTS